MGEGLQEGVSGRGAEAEWEETEKQAPEGGKADEMIETNEGRVLTCVYCGQEYPQETPAWGDKVLTDHIRVCPKHPMRQAEADIDLLRNALAGLVGASDKVELEKMELVVRVIPAPEADKIASLNAIHALLATFPNAQKGG